MRPNFRAATREDGPNLLGEEAWPNDVRPERPDGQPAQTRAAAVAPSVLDPTGALVSEPAVQLDEHALFLVGDVVAFGVARERTDADVALVADRAHA
jgi:hypothetical protein